MKDEEMQKRIKKTVKKVNKGNKRQQIGNR